MKVRGFLFVICLGGLLALILLPVVEVGGFCQSPLPTPDSPLPTPTRRVLTGFTPTPSPTPQETSPTPTLAAPKKDLPPPTLEPMPLLLPETGANL